MYEAGFIGLMIFGMGQDQPAHAPVRDLQRGVVVVDLAMWILDANSWMQTPKGVALKNGVFVVEDWFKALFNPDVIYSFPHMLVASYELAICVVASISAYYVLTQRHVPLFQRALKWSILALVVIAPLQIYLGDGTGLTVSEDQPATLAAMEGHWDTYNKDGSVNTGWHLIAWPNEKGDGNAWAVTIPHVLSLLETHSWSGKVQGLNDFKPEDRPPFLVPFYGFRVMVGCGMALFAVALWGAWLAWRKKLEVATASANRWFLRAVVASAGLPYIAIWVGWWTREVGRQPWVVNGLMRTDQGVSHMSVAQEVVWLVRLHGLRADGVGRHLVVPQQAGHAGSEHDHADPAGRPGKPRRPAQGSPGADGHGGIAQGQPAGQARPAAPRVMRRVRPRSMQALRCPY